LRFLEYTLSNMLEIVRKLNDFGVLISECWFFDGERHRQGGPAMREFNDNGTLFRERWIEHGAYHRSDGPAVTEWDKYDGSLYTEVWYFEGERHRLGGPAECETYHDCRIYSWYEFGKLHRTDGPASLEISLYGHLLQEAWYVNGKVHRTDGPASTDWNHDGKTLVERWIINDEKFTKEEWDRRKVRMSLQNKVLRASRLLTLGSVSGASPDVLSVIGGFL